MTEIRGTTTLVGLLGWPTSHSLSPPMQNAGFAALELDWAYVPLPDPSGTARRPTDARVSKWPITARDSPPIRPGPAMVSTSCDSRLALLFDGQASLIIDSRPGATSVVMEVPAP